MPAKERNLFESIASFQALYEASLRAARGKRAKPGAAAFLVNLESGAARSISCADAHFPLRETAA